MIRTLWETVAPAPAGRFLSQAECRALAAQVAAYVTSGDFNLLLLPSWQGTLQFSNNVVRRTSEERSNFVALRRTIKGATNMTNSNRIDSESLLALVRRAERLLTFHAETGDPRLETRLAASTDLTRTFDSLEYTREKSAQDAGMLAVLRNSPEAMSSPTVFFESTYRLDPARRAAAVEPLVAPARRAGVQAAGDIDIVAEGTAVIDTYGRDLYYPATYANYSITVRDPEHMASGWAGVSWNDWDRVDTQRLSETALDKCLRSRNPVRIEPGRFTTILEPQAVHQLFMPLVKSLDRLMAEGTPNDRSKLGQGVFATGEKRARFHQRVLDDRITVSADPMDPDCGFVPFDIYGNVYHAATWIKDGVLVELPYYRNYAIQVLGKNTGLPNSFNYRVSGGSATIDEMIATTKRGILVTRFSQIVGLDPHTLMMTGYTRDGTWLIENGAISRAIANLKFVDTPLAVFNNVEMLGLPQRIYEPGLAVVVPPVKVRDFHFTALTDAV